TRKKIPRSNLNRLLSAEAFRNRVGVSLTGNKLVFTHKREKSLSALFRIVEDLATKKKVLDDIWDNTAKRKYLNELEAEGILPTISDALGPDGEESTSPEPDNPKPQEPDKPRVTPSGPAARTTLIRNLDYGLVPLPGNQRALDIWSELKHRLHFGKHDNAIAVLFRVPVELSIENYVANKKLTTVHKEDKLARRYKKVLDHMGESKALPEKQIKDLAKFQRSEVLLSANTFNSYVHHSSFFPSDHHLKSMWDNLAPFVVACLRVG
ncbi:MAG: hypothetical protein AAFY01_04425, partial [Pseudomonadota bacterium]